MSDRFHVSLDDRTEATMEEIEGEIEKIFGNRSAFFRQMVMNYDYTSHKKAKLELINARLDALEKEEEELRSQKERLENEIQEMKQSEKEQENIDVPEKFWEDTMQKIAVRETRDEAASVEERWDRWFEGRYNLYKNNYNSDVGMQSFKEMVLDEMRARGYEDRAEKIE